MPVTTFDAILLLCSIDFIQLLYQPETSLLETVNESVSNVSNDTDVVSDAVSASVV